MTPTQFTWLAAVYLAYLSINGVLGWLAYHTRKHHN